MQGSFKGMNHLFDGYAMLVKVELGDGGALVQQRYGPSPWSTTGAAGFLTSS